MNIKNNIFNNVLVGNYSRGGVIYNNNGEITISDNQFTNTVEGDNIKALIIFLVLSTLLALVLRVSFISIISGVSKLFESLYSEQPK